MARPLTVAALGQLFDVLNRRYWDDRLSRPKFSLVRAGQRGLIVGDDCDWGGWGEVDGVAVIELRETDALVHPSYLRANLLHEMVHHETKVADHRSRAWRSAVRRLSERGALRETI